MPPITSIVASNRLSFAARRGDELVDSMEGKPAGVGSNTFDALGQPSGANLSPKMSAAKFSKVSSTAFSKRCFLVVHSLGILLLSAAPGVSFHGGRGVWTKHIAEALAGFSARGGKFAPACEGRTATGPAGSDGHADTSVRAVSR